jgi:hypothetical protein
VAGTGVEGGAFISCIKGVGAFIIQKIGYEFRKFISYSFQLRKI